MDSELCKIASMRDFSVEKFKTYIDRTPNSISQIYHYQV